MKENGRTWFKPTCFYWALGLIVGSWVPRQRRRGHGNNTSTADNNQPSSWHPWWHSNTTPSGGEVLYVCLTMSRAKHPMWNHVAPDRRCHLVVHVSREAPDATPCIYTHIIIYIYIYIYMCYVLYTYICISIYYIIYIYIYTYYIYYVYIYIYIYIYVTPHRHWVRSSWCRNLGPTGIPRPSWWHYVMFDYMVYEYNMLY